MSLYCGNLKPSPSRSLALLKVLYRKLYDLLTAIQKHGGSRARAAVFFAAFAFFLSQMSVTVSKHQCARVNLSI